MRLTDRHKCGYSALLRAKSGNALLNRSYGHAFLAMRNLESSHRRTLSLWIGQGRRSVGLLKFGQPRLSFLNSIIELSSYRIGNHAIRIGRFHRVFHEGVDRKLLVHVLEEVFLPPSLEHSERNMQGGKIEATCQDDCLVCAVLREPGHLPQAQFPLHQSDLAVVEVIFHTTSLDASAV